MKIGDKVKMIGLKYTDSNCRNHVGEGYTIIALHSDSYSMNGYYGRLWKLHDKNGYDTFGFDGDLQLINKNMNLKDKFTLAFKGEPEKSFRKTGITNGDDFLTEDGQHVFLGWLLKKHGEEFKKDVVDDILKEQEEEKK